MRLPTLISIVIAIIILLLIISAWPKGTNQEDTGSMVSSSMSSPLKDSSLYKYIPFSSSLSSSSQMSSSSSISNYSDTSIEYEVTPNTFVVPRASSASQEVIAQRVLPKENAQKVIPKETTKSVATPSIKSPIKSTPKVVVSESPIVASSEPVQEQSQSSKGKSSSSKSIPMEKQSWAKHYEGIESVPETLPANVLVISKSKQTFTLIRDNKEVLTGDVTTGGHFPDPTGGWSETHDGVYWVSNKSRNVKMELFGTPDKVSDYFISLRGQHNVINGTEEYAGIHDSPWRSKFGSEVDYKNKGTNGCITAPSDLVEKLFDRMQLNDLVYIID